MKSKIPKEKLKLLYNEILRGFSSYYDAKLGTVFLKHFSATDAGEIELQYETYVDKARAAGLPTYEEKHKYLLEEGFWTREKDDEIADLKRFIDTLKITKSKTIREAELNEIKRQIETYEQKLNLCAEEKNSLFQFTAEDFASKKINEYYIYSAFYRDKQLSVPLFNTEEFDDLEDSEVFTLVNIYNTVFAKFNDYCLKSIALFPGFFNLFCLSESAYEFYGKPVVALTNNQAEIYTHGKFFKNLFANATKKPPEHLMDDPEGLTDWYESIMNLQDKTGNKNGSTDINSMMGLSAKDRERLGADTDTTKNPLNNLMQMATAKGGDLNMYEIMSVMNK